jgi:DNA invertase Pin-like site-specific DNA recombinase
VTTTRALGYVRVSTDEQHDSGAGLEAQRQAIRDECDRRGWQLVDIKGEDRGASGKSLERKGLQSALGIMDRHGADVLVVSKLDRLSRSLVQGVAVIERAQRKRWALVALDFGLDTTTPAGELVAGVLLTTAQYERRLIGQRTRDALAVRKAAGVVLGARQVLTDDVVARIVDARAAGVSLPKIAAALNADNVATARGGVSWYPSTVAKVLQSAAALRLAVAS